MPEVMATSSCFLNCALGFSMSSLSSKIKKKKKKGFLFVKHMVNFFSVTFLYWYENNFKNNNSSKLIVR